MNAPDFMPLEKLRLADRPLIVCDVDEVVLEYLTPFTAFLRSRDHDLLPRSFRLHGNIVERGTGSVALDAVVDALQEEFFAAQEHWQTPAALAVETLMALGRDADIVFLTAMPPRHAEARRRLLQRIGLTFPMVATEAAKGPVVQALHGDRPLPVAFIDDIHYNHRSVGESVPDALLVRLMANQVFLAMAPDPGERVRCATCWNEANRLIRTHFQGVHHS
ncbi:hypothetical protein [Mycoplana rhizolycopersici]|nr:hypothetical protein [Rhizobium rhizolycopersici]